MGSNSNTLSVSTLSSGNSGQAMANFQKHIEGDTNKKINTIFPSAKDVKWKAAKNKEGERVVTDDGTSVYISKKELAYAVQKKGGAIIDGGYKHQAILAEKLPGPGRKIQGIHYEGTAKVTEDGKKKIKSTRQREEMEGTLESE